MTDEKKLRILIEAILKEKGFKDTERAMKDLGKQSEETGDKIKETGKNLDGMMEKTASFIGSFGMVMTVIGGAVTPLIKSADAYVNKAGLANETTRTWLATTNQLEVAQTKLGKVNAEFLTPMYSKFGDFVEKMGNFAEKNPALTIVGELTAGAVGTIGAGQILTGLLGKLGMAGAAGVSAGLGGVLPFVTVGGVAVAGEVAIAEAQKNQAVEIVKENTEAGNVRVDPSKLSGAQLFAYAIGAESDPYWGVKQWESPNGEKKQGEDENLLEEANNVGFWDKLITSIKEAFSGVKTSGTVVQPVVAGQSTTTPYERLGLTGKNNFLRLEDVQMMMQYRKQELLAQEDFNRSYNYAVEDFNRNRLYQEQDYERQRYIALRNFGIQQAQSEKMFYLQRAIAQRDFQISQARNDYDYHKNRMRAEEDYNFSLQQIMLSGDALAYYYAKRQHEIDERRAEEDYQLQKDRATEDFNRSQADSLMFYQIQREFAIQQFELSMEDREVEYQIMRERASTEFYDVTLRRMDEEYKIMADRRLQSFYESIVPGILKEDELKLYYQSLYLDAATQGFMNTAVALQNYFNQYIQSLSESGWSYWTPPSYGPQMATGGYTTDQMYHLHDHEFVLNRHTTESIENVAQGRLTQEKVLNLLTGGGGGLVYNDNRQFSRGLSSDERAMLRQELQQIVVEAFR